MIYRCTVKEEMSLYFNCLGGRRRLFNLVFQKFNLESTLPYSVTANKKLIYNKETPVTNGLPLFLGFVNNTFINNRSINIELNNLCCVRYKSSKTRNRKPAQEQETDSDTDDEDADSDEDDTYNDIELPDGVPETYKDVKIHSLRADHIVGKGLLLTNSETETLFYKSKFLFNGRTLLKKSQKLNIGDYVDAIMDMGDEKSLVVKRVMVIENNGLLTKKGKCIVTVRCWRQPFELKNI